MENAVVVIDPGSGYTKSGFSGWNEPQMILPSIVNYRPCKENPGPSSARRRLGLGIDILNPETFSHPIQRGRVLNWEGVEHIWSSVLNKLRMEHEDAPVLVTETPLKDPVFRKKTLEIMFELLDVPALLMADQLAMSLYSSGLLTGVVVDSGFGLTRIQPFHLGSPIQHTGRTLEFAGQDLSDYLSRSLFGEDSDAGKLFQLQTVDAVKMNQCYVPKNLVEALDYRQSLPSGQDEDNSYQLPDGTSVELTPMQRLAPEMFFSPQLFDQEQPSLSQAVLDSVNGCDDALHSQLLSHVIACGGNTLSRGFNRRLFMEVASSHSSFPNAALCSTNKRNFSVWLGASLVAHLSTYKSEWMTREEYDEK